MVLPRRPANTNEWNIDDLVSIVTRDAMTGAAVVADPNEQQAHL
jgi:nitrile hydratase subunit alpha